MGKAVDVFGTGKITFEDYAAAIVDWREITKDKRYYHLCRQVFEEFDTNKDGYIDREELRAELPGTLTAKEAKKMISEADTKGSGKIDFKDFVFFIQEKLGSADMFDKRLSSRYRNSFPKRTNSFLRKLNLAPRQEEDKSTSDVSMAEADSEGAEAPDGLDFNKSI